MATATHATTRTRPGPAVTSSRVLLRWALLLAPVALLAIGAWHRRWVSDDGFINLRVVHQLTSGNGPVFNAGQRVEASTSPLWIYVLAVADLVLPVRLEWIAVVLGIGLTLAGLTLAILGSRALWGDDEPNALFVPAGAAVFVVLLPVWTFSSSGLENGLAGAWLGGSLWLLARWSAGDRRLSWPTAVLLGLGPLIRPELAIL